MGMYLRSPPIFLMSEEEHGLEEGVRHQVEDRDGVGRRAQRHRHVAQLRERGIGHHALDVVLHDRHQRHEERGDGADHDHERERRLGELE
jgi:hypothetical protein